MENPMAMSNLQGDLDKEILYHHASFCYV
jgi:hypothetical protein